MGRALEVSVAARNGPGVSSEVAETKTCNASELTANVPLNLQFYERFLEVVVNNTKKQIEVTGLSLAAIHQSSPFKILQNKSVGTLSAEDYLENARKTL